MLRLKKPGKWSAITSVVNSQFSSLTLTPFTTYCPIVASRGFISADDTQFSINHLLRGDVLIGVGSWVGGQQVTGGGRTSQGRLPACRHRGHLRCVNVRHQLKWANKWMINVSALLDSAIETLAGEVSYHSVYSQPAHGTQQITDGVMKRRVPTGKMGVTNSGQKSTLIAGWQLTPLSVTSLKRSRLRA